MTENRREHQSRKRNTQINMSQKNRICALKRKRK